MKRGLIKQFEHAKKSNKNITLTQHAQEKA